MKNDVLHKLSKAYKEQNPSKYLKIINKKNLQKFVENRINFLLKKLKLPSKIFNKAKVLDLGCGSGQNSILYDHMGANCTLVEYDKKSYENAKILFKKYSKNKFKIINNDIFKFKSSEKFDFVISDGVAHHTHSPIKNIQLASRYLKNGGFLILGIGETNGFFQRNLQRLILYNISKNKEDIIKFSKILFKESLKRSLKYGGRTINEIIFDTYVVPIHCLSFSKIDEVFNKENLYLYSMDENTLNIQNIYNVIPSQFKVLGNPKIMNDRFQSNYLLNTIINFSLSYQRNGIKKNIKQIEDIIKIQNSISEDVNDISFQIFKSKINLKKINTYYSKIKNLSKIDIIDIKNQLLFIKEVKKIIKILQHKDKETKFKKIKEFLSKNKRLFRKFNGKGQNYFVGYKY